MIVGRNALTGMRMIPMGWLAASHFGGSVRRNALTGMRMIPICCMGHG